MEKSMKGLFAVCLSMLTVGMLAMLAGTVSADGWGVHNSLHFTNAETKAYAEDSDNDGFDDYIKVEFNVDHNAYAPHEVTVRANLYEGTWKLDSSYITYRAEGKKVDVHTLYLYPPLERPGTYKVQLILRPHEESDDYDIVDQYVTSVYFHRNWYPVADAGEDIFYELPKDTPDDQVKVTITFDASHSYDKDGTIVSYKWDFGDGTTATGMVVSHTFTAFGNYRVTLTVTDNDGYSCVDIIYVSIYKPWSLPGFEALTVLAALGVIGAGMVLLSRRLRRC
jgi:PKD repeat protein